MIRASLSIEKSPKPLFFGKLHEMKISSLLRVGGLAAIACVSSLGFAQTTGTQGFKVVVPENISIAAPAAVQITHDQSNNPQAFPAQSWVVKGNVRNGVTVEFSTGSAFVHTQDPTYKRNAKLDLAVGTTQGPASWSLVTASSTTNYTNNTNALVKASSNKPGRANLDLTVTFLTENYDEFAAGDYTTTITGTVTANP
jgi:hypothetical protein